MDMCDPYRSVASRFFPNARLVADKYFEVHVDHLGKRLVIATVFDGEEVVMKKNSGPRTGTICPSCGKGKLTFKAGKRDLGPLLGLNEVTVENLSRLPASPAGRFSFQARCSS
jgi:hypothetical protein